MIYEMRTYRFDGNDGQKLATRFRHHSLPLLNRHGIQLLVIWEAIIGNDLP